MTFTDVQPNDALSFVFEGRNKTTEVHLENELIYNDEIWYGIIYRE